jgi:hypothetical protein
MSDLDKALAEALGERVCGGKIEVVRRWGCGYSGCNAPTYHAAEGCPSRPQTIALASPTPEQQEIARLRGALREAVEKLQDLGYETTARRLAAALGEEEG